MVQFCERCRLEYKIGIIRAFSTSKHFLNLAASCEPGSLGRISFPDENVVSWCEPGSLI